VIDRAIDGIIDAHIHVGSWLHADFLGRENDVAGTLAMLTASGVDGAVVMPSDRCDNEALRDGLLAARGSFAGPLWMCAWIQPDDDLGWIRRNRHDLAGLKIHPSLSRRRITDDGFRPALELAAAEGLVVLLHCGRWQEIAGWAHAIDAAQRHPDVRFVLAHAGGDTPPFASAAAHAVKERGLTNVWFEFSGLREYWVVERNVALIGADRYMMGSDYPLAHPLMYMGAIKGMALAEGDKAKILGGNARAVFGKPL
jgi:predicted TIM-barrel fold metal-dependent hydrolase